jgi:diguanylate cyclase (GGDEF)-like protein
MTATEPACAGPASDVFKTVAQQGPPRPDRRDACIVYIYPTGPLMGQRYPLSAGPVLIGRNDDCQVPNPDASVSRHHARIELRDDGRYHVTDLGSTNKTFINNTALADGALADGDYLRIGNCIYRFLASGNLEAEYHEEIYRLTVLDGLTGVPNRRYFQEFVEREVARAVRHERPLALALMDIDHFKQVNDRLGHLAGDLTLRQVAATAAAVVRRDELFARYGGEEFALVLPESDGPAAAAACERVRQAVAAHEFVFNKQPYKVTVSIGIGVLAGDGPATAAELVRRADAMLYRAKADGRNRVCAAG